MALHIDRYVGDEEVLCDGTVCFNGVDRGVWDLRITPTRIIVSGQSDDSVSVIFLKQICFVNLCCEYTSPSTRAGTWRSSAATSDAIRWLQRIPSGQRLCSTRFSSL